ncbi:MAG: protein kinase [Nannocystaceae bacterium]|nr:protein kinase [Nannocystaceae bacterium]
MSDGPDELPTTPEVWGEAPPARSDAAHDHDAVPDRIGRYRVLECIGHGGMGVVYAAHDDELDRTVALKVLRRELAPGSRGRQRLLREAQAAAKLAHPNVVHVYEVGQAHDQVFMAMELVRGPTLRAWREQRERGWQDVVAIYLQAGEGLVAAHAEGLVHRDFKPDNVLVDRDGRPQIVDFGLARAGNDGNDTGPVRASDSHAKLPELDVTRTGTIVGTPAYMPPEQLARAEPSARGDQFSFCASLFEALYGRRPFAGSTYSEIEHSLTRGSPIAPPRRAEIPRAVHDAVMRGLSRDPGDRFGSMCELLDALRTASSPRSRGRFGFAAVATLALAAAAVALTRGDRPVPAAVVDTTMAAAPEPTPPDPWAEIVAASDLPPVREQPAPDDPLGTTVHRLRNGLTLYIATRPDEPYVAAALVLRTAAGQADDAAPGVPGLLIAAIMRGTERIGIADAVAERPLRVFQHRLIESLPQLPEPARALVLEQIAASERVSSTLSIYGEPYQAIRALGGREPVTVGGQGMINAAEMPRHRLDAWLQVTAESWRRPVFRQFLGAAAEQLQIAGWLSVAGHADEEIRAALAPATGLVGGRMAAAATAARVPLAEVREFHARYARPNNAAIVLVGDVTPAEVLPQVERWFGDWEPAPIPATPPIDQPLPTPRTVIDVEDATGREIDLVWPMPPVGSEGYARMAQLAAAMTGRKGLLERTMNRATHGWVMLAGRNRDLRLMLLPRPDQSDEDAEAAGIASLQRIADGEFSDDDWRAMLDDSALSRLSWARGPASSMWTLTSAFLEHAREPGGLEVQGPGTRDQASATAAALLRSGHLVVRQHPGKAWRPQLPQLPKPADDVSAGRRSAWVREILDAPTPPVEPRFLVDGSHYELQRHGAGRVVTSTTPGPLFRLTWIYPVGAREDPWACEAMRPRLRQAPIPGVEIFTLCTLEDTRYQILGSAALLEQHLPQLITWLHTPVLTPTDAREYTAYAVGQRGEARLEPNMMVAAAEAWALLGDDALDRWLPSDAELARKGATEMLRAEAALMAFDADVLYAGPNPEALVAALPEPTQRTAGVVTLPRAQLRERPTVWLLDEPAREGVVVRVAVPWRDDEARAGFVAAIHREHVRNVSWEGPLPLDLGHPGYAMQTSPATPLAIGVGLRVAPGEVERGIDTALAQLRTRPSPSQFAAAHRRLEAEFRALRTAPPRVPELVYAWRDGGTDPRVQQWLALPGLSYDDVTRYFDALDASAPSIVVVGDLDAVDLDALARRWPLVRLDPAQVLRETGMSGLGYEVPSLMGD